MPVLDFAGAPRAAKAHPPSPQQAEVYKWVREGSGNLNLIAVAGSGKTTTLREACKLMSGRVALAAYNKRIADEIAARLAADGIGSNVQARTFHSFGMQMLKSVFPNTKLDTSKTDTILNRFVSEHENELRGVLTKLISLAKNHAVGHLWSMADIGKWEKLIDHYGISFGDEDLDSILNIACESLQIAQATLDRAIDFDDMIWGPLVSSCPLQPFDWVLVDEAQDTNPARRELAKLMLAPTGRAIFVGDPHQAIYGFTGADADALDLIKKDFKCAELPLSVTYRCPKKVVSFAQNWVSHITAADSAPEGNVRSQSLEDFRKGLKEVRPTSAVLCRNTRPLVSLAFEFIRAGISCHVEGRDIGRGLIALTQRWKVPSLNQFLDRLSDYREREISKLKARGKLQEAESLEDKVATIRVIASWVRSQNAGGSVWDLKSAITKLFDDTPEGQKAKRLVFSTVHKAKGREWPTVYLLDRANLMPSKYAVQDWQLEQEDNLIYVAVTRAQEQLIELVVDPIQEVSQ